MIGAEEGVDAATLVTFLIIGALCVWIVVAALLSEDRDAEERRRTRRIRRELQRHPYEDLTDETTVRLVHGRRGDDE